MKFTGTQTTVHMKMIPMQDLRPVVEEALLQKGIRPDLENLTENDMNFRLSRTGYVSHLSMSRVRHKPLDVEIEIDYNYYNYQNEAYKQMQKRSRRRSRGSGSMFRTYWILWIFLGVIISVLSFFSGLLVGFINALTPGWSSEARAVALVAFVILVLMLWIYALPMYNRGKGRQLKLVDTQVLAHLVNRLEEFDTQRTGFTTLKCWNCFEPVSINERHCTHCGAQQK